MPENKPPTLAEQLIALEKEIFGKTVVKEASPYMRIWFIADYLWAIRKLPESSSAEILRAVKLLGRLREIVDAAFNPEQ
jgi:hypothetical protein